MSPLGIYGATLCAAHRRLLTLIALVACSTICVLAFSDSASAGVKGVVSSFGSTGTLGDQFKTPRGIALNQTTGSVYVVDGANNRVQELSSSGVFQLAFGVNVEGAGKNVCTVAAACTAGTASAAAGGMSAPQGVAVEQTTGDVYVTDQTNHRVDEFEGNGTFVRAFGLNVGGSGVNVCTTSCVAGTSSAAAGGFSTTIGYPSVDPTTGDVYVASSANRRVDVFEASGAFKQAFGWGVSTGASEFQVCTTKCQAGVASSTESSPGRFASGSPTRVAVDAAGNVYAVDGASPDFRVQKFAAYPSNAVLVEYFSSASLTGASSATAVSEVSVLPTVGGSVFAAREPSSPAEHLVYELSSGGAVLATDGLGARLPATSGLAAATSGGNVYLSTASNRVLVLNTPVAPTATIDAPSGVGAEEATLSGEVNPNGLSTTYRFEYSTDQVTWSTIASGNAGSGTLAVPVEAKVTGLEGNTSYFVRLHVEKELSGGSATSSEVEFTTPAAVPTVAGVSFSQAGSSGVTLRATINPQHADTIYRFEYGTTESYGSETSVVSIGAGSTAVQVRQPVDGLQPSTDYHFRVVATNQSGSATSADVAFATLGLAGGIGLPDGRGYELVTPAENEGAQVYVPRGDRVELENGETIPTERPFRAAADGHAVAYTADPTAEGNGSQGEGFGNEYLASRNASGGWSQQALQPPGFEGPRYWSFSSDLSTGVLTTNKEALTTGAPNLYEDLYVRDSSGALQSLLTATPPNRTPGEFGAANLKGQVSEGYLGLFYAGASADSTHQFFEANDALTAGAVDGGASENNLYESAHGALRLVNVLPDGSSEPGASFGAPPAEVEEAENASRAISADGSRVFWTDTNTGSLYVREGATSTRLVAEGATFWTASVDGARVLYAKEGDLYEDDLSTDVNTDLTPGGQVLGLAGSSEDARYVYFVAEGALVPGATAGQPNLYLYHSGVVKLVATLAPEAVESKNEMVSYGLFDDWRPGLGHRTAQASADGQSLVFVSKQSLTGYDNRNEEGEAVSEVYVYDANAERVSCASCIASGEPPPLSLSKPAAELPMTLSKAESYDLRTISGDGSRVFFESEVPLVAQDVNGKPDVYEWERDGSGSCETTQGCVYLLSDGANPSPSYFLDASANGSDIFIITSAQLSAADQNELYDVYDVRVGAVAPTAPSQCTGTGCQGLPAAPPIFATPSSVTFSGVGNFTTEAEAVVAKPKPKKKPKKKPKRKASHKSRQGRKSDSKAKRGRGLSARRRSPADGSNRGGARNTKGRGKG